MLMDVASIFHNKIKHKRGVSLNLWIAKVLPRNLSTERFGTELFILQIKAHKWLKGLGPDLGLRLVKERPTVPHSRCCRVLLCTTDHRRDLLYHTKGVACPSLYSVQHRRDVLYHTKGVEVPSLYNSNRRDLLYYTKGVGGPANVRFGKYPSPETSGDVTVRPCLLYHSKGVGSHLCTTATNTLNRAD